MDEVIFFPGYIARLSNKITFDQRPQGKRRWNVNVISVNVDQAGRMASAKTVKKAIVSNTKGSSGSLSVKRNEPEGE